MTEIQRHFSTKEEQRNYIASVITLLREMFHGNPCDRLSPS
ncbi:unnamed protein product [Fusarium venenatum]|uniref:Uncharacterized protein n=1 Tax=Fusarium venenatum TaxID=56646 RepID=A0A2L2T6J0_9HYPO|nr:uncharacterized protein FVRRES_13750 [Fusarium venenatum]CEI41804.1 unnamed protein product [Fusarium venenatum]